MCKLVPLASRGARDVAWAPNERPRVQASMYIPCNRRRWLAAAAAHGAERARSVRSLATWAGLTTLRRVTSAQPNAPTVSSHRHTHRWHAKRSPTRPLSRTLPSLSSSASGALLEPRWLSTSTRIGDLGSRRLREALIAESALRRAPLTEFLATCIFFSFCAGRPTGRAGSGTHHHLRADCIRLSVLLNTLTLACVALTVWVPM